MPIKKRINFIGYFLLLAWVVFCVSYFIWFPGRQDFVHGSTLGSWEPLLDRFNSLQFFDYFQSFVFSLLGIALYSFGCIFTGAYLLSWVFLKNEVIQSHPISTLVFLANAFLIGSSIFSIVFLLLAAMGHLTPLNVGAIILVGYIFGFTEVKIRIQRIYREKSYKFNKVFPTWNARTIALFSISILVLSIFHAATRISYDASATYFSNAKITAIANRIQYFESDNFPANIFPLAIQFSALIQIFGDHTARILTWINGIVIVIFGLAIGERVGLSRLACVILLAMIVTSTAFTDLLGDGKVDLMGTAPALASVYWMTSSGKIEKLNKDKFLLIGFYAGFAFVARPFNVFLLGVFAFLFFFPLEVKNNLRGTKSIILSFYPLFWIGLGAIGWGFYYLFVNWLILDDPFAFLASILAIDPSAGPWTYEPEKLLLVRFFYPFMVTFVNYGATLGNITPLFVAFSPLLFIRRIQYPTLLAKTSIVSAVTLLFWVFLFFTVWEVRYVLFIWIVLYMPVSMVLSEALLNGNYVLKSSIYGSLFLLFTLMLLRSVYVSIEAYSSIDEKRDPHCYGSSFCEVTKTINETAPLGARVLVLHASRYYLRSDLFLCSTTPKEYRYLKELSLSSTAGFWDELLRLGYQYIIVDYTFTERHLGLGFVPEPENLPAGITLGPMYESQNNQELSYKINVSGRPIEQDVVCRENLAGIWELSTMPKDE